MTPSIPNESFQRLVREHHEGVYRTARVLSGSEADALDVTQQVFLRVLDGRLRLAEAEDPARLLRWQAVREARMARRSARRRRRREDRHAMQRPSRTEDEPSARIEEQETRGVLAGLLDALPEDLATALTLRFRASWTYAEIGASLGISEPSAHARVQRGLERLRRGLARMGLAGQAVLIPELLAGAPPAPLPAGIEQDLLSLSSTAAVAARSTAALWIAAALTAGLALGTAALGGAFSSRDGRAASDPTSLEAARPAAQRTPPPPPTARDDWPAAPGVAPRPGIPGPLPTPQGDPARGSGSPALPRGLPPREGGGEGGRERRTRPGRIGSRTARRRGRRPPQPAQPAPQGRAERLDPLAGHPESGTSQPLTTPARNSRRVRGPLPPPLPDELLAVRKEAVMSRFLAHSLCRFFEFMIALGVLQVATSLGRWIHG